MSIFIFVSLAGGLPLLLSFLGHQLFLSLIFSVAFQFSVSLISALSSVFPLSTYFGYILFFFFLSFLAKLAQKVQKSLKLGELFGNLCDRNQMQAISFLVESIA